VVWILRGRYEQVGGQQPAPQIDGIDQIGIPRRSSPATSAGPRERSANPPRPTRSSPEPPTILNRYDQLAMDSLPQELIDKIIDDLPRSSLLSCSLVAKRWRRRSQQRAFEKFVFSFKDDMDRWCTNISQGPGGLSSYVRHIAFAEIDPWNDPAAPGRVLKNLGSLKTLWICGSAIPDELPAQISRGEFGKEITTLYIDPLPCALAPIVSMILSLPNLKRLHVGAYGTKPGEPLSTQPISLQKGPLDFLEIDRDTCGLGEALAKSRLTSRHLSLGVNAPGVKQLIMRSSETVVGLNLYGVWFW